MTRQGTGRTDPWADLTRLCSRTVAREAEWMTEFAREVKVTTADSLRRANRSVRRAADDMETELIDLNREIAALARGALRARTDRPHRR